MRRTTVLLLVEVTAGRETTLLLGLKAATEPMAASRAMDRFMMM